MANMIILEGGIARTKDAVNGEELTIQAPCNCAAVTGVQIANVAYPFCDAAGNALPMGTGLFTEGSLIRVLIDTVNTRAMILNQPAVSKGVFDSLSHKTLMSDKTAAKYGFSGENATVDNALDALARYLLAQGITTVTVQDEDGNPIPGVTFSGVVGSSGEAVATDANGAAQVVVTADVPVTVHSGYVDIPDCEVTLTPDFEEINAITIVMPYAESDHIETILDSGSVKFRKARTVHVALVGGGNGGEEGTIGAMLESGYGGNGGDGGKILNAIVSVNEETEYPVVIGAGGCGEHGTVAATAGGATTAFDYDSANGSAKNYAFDDDSIMAGGDGGDGGDGHEYGLVSGGTGWRCGGNGGDGGIGNGGTGGWGYDGTAPGGGGGGGGGAGRTNSTVSGIAGGGGDGASGGVLIKF